MSKPFVTLFSLKNVTQSMKMNVKLFTRRDAPLNMNLNAQQVLLTMGGFISFFKAYGTELQRRFFEAFWEGSVKDLL